MFSLTAPHFLLLTQAQSGKHSIHSTLQGGVWRFVLEEMGGNQRIEATETEPGVWGERLQLLAVIRGLEALEQPSRVTLITPSRFVGNGIRINLKQWRQNRWQWEHFGEMLPIKNVDLWKRIDQALQFHQLDCRIWDIDLPWGNFEQEAEPKSERQPQTQPVRKRITFEEIQQGRRERQHQSPQRVGSGGGSSGGAPVGSQFRIKPMGRGRAFGLCDAMALSTVSFTG